MSHSDSLIHNGRSFDSCIAIPAPNYEKQKEKNSKGIYSQYLKCIYSFKIYMCVFEVQ